MVIQRYFIGKVAISKINLEYLPDIIEDALIKGNIGYICVTNARSAYYSNRNKDYLKIQNSSLLTVPDGMPLVWLAHNRGLCEVGKISGKDLMDRLFSISDKKNYSHYLYGSTPNTNLKLLINLERLFPNLIVKKIVSPPFQSIDKFDIEALASELNELKPTFFWCGLGAPKQEQLIAQLQPKLKKTICIGVGLAFEYWAGTVKRAPEWMQKSGLEWVYRLSQQPKNIKRAVIPLTWIFFKVIFSLIKRKKCIKNQ